MFKELGQSEPPPYQEMDKASLWCFFLLCWVLWLERALFHKRPRVELVVPRVVMFHLSEVRPGSKQLGCESLNLGQRLMLVREDALCVRTSACWCFHAGFSALPCHSYQTLTKMLGSCMLFEFSGNKNCSNIILLRNKIGSDILL